MLTDVAHSKHSLCHLFGHEILQGQWGASLLPLTGRGHWQHLRPKVFLRGLATAHVILILLGEVD
jgi:hypothetical protein